MDSIFPPTHNADRIGSAEHRIGTAMPRDEPTKVGIIGAGWFGATIALELIDMGIDVRLFEARDEMFGGASGYNQNRLHLGFHYPRSYKTREQTRVGFRRFMQQFPQFSRAVPRNVYAVCEERSLIDFQTYLQVMEASGLRFQERPSEEFGLRNVEGCLTCGERRIETRLAKSWFETVLKDHANLNCPITHVRELADGVELNGERFDLVVNCSNQTYSANPKWSIIYEACLTLVYEGDPNHPALTLMDGPFFTIYPFEGNRFTVYSVTHTRKGRYSTAAEAQARLNSLTRADVDATRQTIEEEIQHHYPAFRDLFRFGEPHRSLRAIFPDRSDARPCLVSTESRVVQVMAGKIDAVFFAVDEVKRCLTKFCSPVRPVESAPTSRGYSRSA